MKRARTPSTAKKAARRAARGAAAAALALAPSAAAVAPSTARVAMPSPAAAARPPILRLGADNLVRGTFVQRPSARNKSPYVGDVRLADGRVAICHMPSLDMGGKLRPGVEVLMKTSVDKSGAPIGADALGKYGTPTCEFVAQLLRCVARLSPRHPANCMGNCSGASSPRMPTSAACGSARTRASARRWPTRCCAAAS